MNQPAAYTPLESLFLFQSLLAQGIDAGAFERISESLRNNQLIKEDENYDPTRLGADALQNLFLRLFRDELKGGETERTDATTTTNTNEGTGSPGSMKRKIGNSPLPTLKDVYENVEKIPALVDRLYARYKDHVIKQIRDDERRFESVQKGIQILEKNESSRRARAAASQNGTPVLAPRETKPFAQGNGSASSPAPTSGTAYPGMKMGPTPHTPVVPPKPPTPQGASPTVALPSHLPPGTPPIRPSPSPKPANGTASVLQAPAGVPPQSAPRPLQQPPRQAISPRPEVGIKPKDTTPSQQSAAQASGSGPGSGSLKWEKPYQPQGQAAQTPPRQFQSPVPPGHNIQPAPPTAPSPQQLPQQHQTQHTQHPQHPNQRYPQHQQPQGQTPQTQHPSRATQSPQPPQNGSNPQPQLIPSRPQPGKPVLVPPQNVGQVPPPLQPTPPRPTTEVSGVHAPQVRPSLASMAPPSRPMQAPQLQNQQTQQTQQAQQAQQAQQSPRPIASASAAQDPPAGVPTPIAPPQQRWPQPQPQSAQPLAQSPSSTSLPAQKDKSYSSPYTSRATRPAIPEHVIRQVVTTPGPKRNNVPPSQPQTPVSSGSALLLHGFGTKWASQSTPSTPGPLNTDPQSPAYEAVSPPPRSATLASSTPKTISKKQAPKSAQKIETPVPAPRLGRGRPARSGHGVRGASATPSGSGYRRSLSVTSHKDELNKDELAMDHAELAPIVKNEEATPKLTEDAGDTTADESVHGRQHNATPSATRTVKRKRRDSPMELPQPPPTAHVLWTRGFTKVSSSALDQISSHRDANMFATALREKDAPNYRQIVLQPQDITSIRSAIKHGNKAAMQASANLPGGDPGTANVWLPTSEELVPPKGIINSAQLERELVHMFCNAIMYNADPDRGPGPSFIKRSQDEEEEIVGYRLDENGVVKNTRSMFVEVEKLLGDLRSAEKERSAPPPSATRPASVATPADDTGVEDEDELAGDGDMTSGTVKRRRIGTRG